MDAFTSNPLLDAALFQEGLFPRFDLIDPSHVVPGVTGLLQEAEARLLAIEQTITPTWDGAVFRVSELGEWLEQRWSLVSHLVSVRNSPELRAAHQEVQPAVVEFCNRMAQSKAVYNALLEIRHSSAWDTMPQLRRRVITSWLREAKKAGVALAGDAALRYREIVSRKAQLGTLFMNHLLDDTNEKGLLLTDPAEVETLPKVLIGRAVQEAQKRGYNDATLASGPWFIPVDGASYRPFMEHCPSAVRRAEMYRLYMTRAAIGERDNSPLIKEILALSYERSELVGYSSPAAMSLDGKMAENVTAVRAFLEDILRRAKPVAIEQFARLQHLAAERGEGPEVKASDIPFLVERLREQEIGLTSEMLRPYFPLEQVISGLFALTERLFGVKVTSCDGKFPVWHPDVRLFELRNIEGAKIGYFYLDPYSRPGEKRGGAWMDICVSRKRGADNSLQLPVAYLVCNQTPPGVAEEGTEIPSLMSFDEVSTLFHEFGHGLQHLLTRIDEKEVSGINNVEWDAVEIASQFMENWLYDRATLESLALHYETKAPLPKEWLEKLLASQKFMKALPILTQILYGLVDLQLYENFDPLGSDPHELFRSLGEQILLLPPHPDGRFLCGFSHIFAGGYSAGYYSYLWSEVLSADVFAAFLEADTPDELATCGRKLQETIFGLGGADDPLTIFKMFRGREPDIEAFLLDKGLV